MYFVPRLWFLSIGASPGACESSPKNGGSRILRLFSSRQRPGDSLVWE